MISNSYGVIVSDYYCYSYQIRKQQENVSLNILRYVFSFIPGSVLLAFGFSQGQGSLFGLLSKLYGPHSQVSLREKREM